MKVSIYCKVYNHEKYLRSALDGFVNQKTNFKYEVFVHDDASTDKSAEIILEYAEKYPKIIKPIIQKENQYSKRVRIFRDIIHPRMTGEYIASCEGDDYWCDNEKLQKQVDFLDSHKDYIACTHNTIKIDFWRNKKYPMYGNEDKDLCFSDVVPEGGCCYHTSSLIYRAEYASNQPDFVRKVRSYSDYPFSLYLALSGKIRYLKDVMSVYRYGTKSSWTRKVSSDMSKTCRIINSKIELLKDVDEYSNHTYKRVIDKAIFNHEYSLLEMQGRYKELRRNPYRSIYKSKPLKYKLKVYAKQVLYKPYLILRKRFYSRGK